MKRRLFLLIYDCNLKTSDTPGQTGWLLLAAYHGNIKEAIITNGLGHLNDKSELSSKDIAIISEKVDKGF